MSLPIYMVMSMHFGLDIWVSKLLLAFALNILQIYFGILMGSSLGFNIKLRAAATYICKVLLLQGFFHPFLFPWLLPLLQISLNGSIWATVSVAIERFISVVHPRFW